MSKHILRVTLPWPSADLSINGRNRWAKIRAVTPARQLAAIETREALRDMPEPGPMVAVLEFHPPTRRKVDCDGLITRAKSYLDGIFDALELDDNCIKRIEAEIFEPTPGGSVTIELRKK